MAYTKQTWQNGDVITDNKLNHMEDGIADAGGGGGLTVIFTENDGTYTADKTFEEVKAARDSHIPIYGYMYNDVWGYYPYTFICGYYDDLGGGNVNGYMIFENIRVAAMYDTDELYADEIRLNVDDTVTEAYQTYTLTPQE